MVDSNLSLVLHGVKDLRLEDRPIPEPKPGEVQVSIRSVGICGSDISYWQKGRIGQAVVRAPMVMGHEPSGVVTKLGPGVGNVSVGDRVAVEPCKPCSRCTMCKHGFYNLCETLEYLASPPVDGSLCRYMCHPANFVHKLPDHVSFDEGALVQPFSLGLHACKLANITVGHAVLITGAGPLGMANVLAAKARGASKICVTDLAQERLDYIQKIGADVTVTVGADDPKAAATKIVAALGREPDVSLECSGSGQATSTAIYATRPRGKVVQIGFGGDTVEIPLVTATVKELQILGSCCLANDYETAVEAIASGCVNVKQLVTHHFKLEQALDAFNASLRGQGVKIIIDCSRDGES